MKKIWLLLLIGVFARRTFGQTPYISHYTLGNSVTEYAIHDTISHVKFVLDTSRIYITAIDPNGKQLWRTDPWKDNKLEAYRVQRPRIVQFYLSGSKQDPQKLVIWIAYNNTQFGFLDMANGKFMWLGQD